MTTVVAIWPFPSKRESCGVHLDFCTSCEKELDAYNGRNTCIRLYCTHQGMLTDCKKSNAMESSYESHRIFLIHRLNSNMECSVPRVDKVAESNLQDVVEAFVKRHTATLPAITVISTLPTVNRINRKFNKYLYIHINETLHSFL